MTKVRPKTTSTKSKLDWRAPAEAPLRAAKPISPRKKPSKRKKQSASFRDLLLFGDYVTARRNDPTLSATAFAAERKVASSVVQQSRQRLEEYFQEILLVRLGRLPPDSDSSDYSEEALAHGVVPLDWQATSKPTPIGEVVAGLANLLGQQFDLMKGRGDVLPSDMLRIQSEMMARCNELAIEIVGKREAAIDDRDAHSVSSGWQDRMTVQTPTDLPIRVGRRVLARVAK